MFHHDDMVDGSAHLGKVSIWYDSSFFAVVVALCVCCSPFGTKVEHTQQQAACHSELPTLLYWNFVATLREVLNWNARYSNSIEVGSLVGMRNEMENEKLLEVSSNKMLTCK